MAKCKRCESNIPAGRLQCKACGMWQTKTSISAGEKDGTILLGDTSIKPMRRYDIGWLNNQFGGGLVTTGVTLMGGAPGAGKSTLALQIADLVIDDCIAEEKRIAKHNAKIKDNRAPKLKLENSGEVLIISAEQFLSELRNMADNLRIKHTNKMRMMPMLEGFTASVDDTIANRKPALVIVDSLPKFTEGDLHKGVDFCEACKAQAMTLGCPFIIIDHVTKEHTLAGLMELQHAVDTTMTLFQRNEGDSQRVFVTKKNRFGADFESCLEMTETGLIACNGCSYCEEQNN